MNWQFMNLHLLLLLPSHLLRLSTNTYNQSIRTQFIFRFYYSLFVFFFMCSAAVFCCWFLFRKEQFIRKKRNKKKFKLQALTLDKGRCKNWIYMEKYFVVSLFVIKTCVNTYFVLNFWKEIDLSKSVSLCFGIFMLLF